VSYKLPYTNSMVIIYLEEIILIVRLFKIKGSLITMSEFNLQELFIHWYVYSTITRRSKTHVARNNWKMANMYIFYNAIIYCLQW